MHQPNGQAVALSRVLDRACSPVVSSAILWSDAPVAQGIEHWPPEPGAAGSNPARRTTSRREAQVEGKGEPDARVALHPP